MGLAKPWDGCLFLQVSIDFIHKKFREGYLRMSSADYATDRLTDDFVHLTNNAI